MVDPRYPVNLIRAFKLRRPFSRKIALRPDDVLTEPGRTALLRRTEPLASQIPLAALLRALACAYGTDAKGHAEIERHGWGPGVRALYGTSDLRSRILDCFRDYCARFGLPPRQLLKPLLDLAQHTDPEFARIKTAADRPPHAPSLLAFDCVPTIPAKLRVNLFVRTRFFGEHSRMHDIGVRIQSALARADIDVRAFSLDEQGPDLPESDLVLVDDPLIFRKDPIRKRAFLERLRASTRRLGCLEFDPWTATLASRIAQNRDLYDFIWAPAPTRIQNGQIAGLPTCLIPFPTGCDDIFEKYALESRAPPGEDIRFCGGIEEYNFHRYFWILALSLLSEAIPCEVTNHLDDGLDVGTSLARYVERLSASYAALSFTMRSDGTSIVVGRTFDALRLGQLLVQEYCPDARYYLTPNEHFLEFQTVEELDAIRAAVRDRAFENIRKNGQEIFAQRYSDEAILRHLATFL
jgi:hypothetical protein